MQYSDVTNFSRNELPEISISAQSTGIEKASKFWSEKVAMETGRSAERLRFTNVVAEFLAKKMHEDKKMSNPGETGFSVLVEELEQFPEALKFLEELADYGNFLMLDHTTKSKNRRIRKKFYLNPVFCPRFRIPYIRTKEPYYANIKQVLEWMHRSQVKINLGAPFTIEEQSLL